MRIEDFAAPDGRASTAAVQLATDYHTPSMFHHVMRSWYWARGFAATEGWIGIDDEMLFVAALLHDIGTTPAFDNHTLSYEEAGGHVAVALTAGAGWPPLRQQRTLQVIVRHNWASVDPSLDVEGYLLEAATALDIAGARAHLIDRGFRDEVLDAYPRLDLAREFVACVADQAERKPTSAAHRIARGLAERMRDHPFER
jgi:cyanamide hydratase family protein with HD domain